MKKRKTAATAPLLIAPTTPLDGCVIAHRAYAIWQAEGEPAGRDLDHWLKAEAELRASSPASGVAAETRAMAKAD